MTSAEKRIKVRDYIFSREGKNQYTQSSKRELVDTGYSDCSSLQQRAYKEIGLDIGSYTVPQIQRGEWVQFGGSLPDENLLEIGDELFFSVGTDNGRPYRVGHIEMYVGNGQISGHGYGIGPVRKNMLDYCRQRNSQGRPFIGVKRYIESDKVETVPQTMFVGECTGNDVNVRMGPGTDYPNITAWPRLNQGNRFEVLEMIGSWYRIRIADQFTGYMSGRYIKRINAAAVPEGTGLNREPRWVGTVTTLLNVRTGAGPEYPKLQAWPQLAKGNKIDVCDTVKIENGDEWYYVRIAGSVYGFVNGRYIVR